MFIEFVVDTNGHVTSSKIMNDIGGGCGEEAKRVIDLTSGLWDPGRYKNKKVKSLLNIPIKYTYIDKTGRKKGDVVVGYSLKDNLNHYYNLGVNAFKREEYLISILYFNKALEINKKDKDALYNRGAAKYKTNNLKGAV